jgi:FkbM family methyltransferase
MSHRRRIFVDVGAHYGETLDIVLDPRWAFDIVYSVEPSRTCQELLRRFRDPRLHIEQRALSDRNGHADLFGAGLLGASLYPDKPQTGGGSTETIEIIRASEWLSQRKRLGDRVFLKLNCEGGEADILEDLLDADALDGVESIYVDFDVRKIPSQAHRQRIVEARLRHRGVFYETPTSLGAAGNDAVGRWLNGVLDPVEVSLRLRVLHACRFYLPPYLRAKAVARTVLPSRAYHLLARRFGRQAQP